MKYVCDFKGIYYCDLTTLMDICNNTSWCGSYLMYRLNASISKWFGRKCSDLSHFTARQTSNWTSIVLNTYFRSIDTIQRYNIRSYAGHSKNTKHKF